MIKNGRPYTNENGWEDGGLITDHGDEVKKSVDGWIGKNIRTAKKILRGRTSYGMKHILEHDTGIYLTNNEFKDAMLLAGYSPVNPGELNWRYRIVLTRDITSNLINDACNLFLAVQHIHPEAQPPQEPVPCEL